MCYVLFLLGLVIIIKSSDYFVDSAIWVAKATGIPDLIIGATLVSVCTTLPEAVVSATSSIGGLSAMAFGNAFGSIAFNTTFILGLTFLVSRPLITGRKSFVTNALFLLALCGGVLAVYLITGGLSRAVGAALLVLLACYLLFNVVSAKKGGGASEKGAAVDKSGREVLKNLLLLALGAAGVVIGSQLLVTNGEAIAKSLGVSELIIGLTITALGTSLPELVTAIAAMTKGAHSMSVGNILGADILNVVLVTGLSAVIRPIRLPDLSSAVFSIGAAMLIAMVVLSFAVFNKKHFTRSNGAALLALYIAYITVNMLYFAR